MIEVQLTIPKLNIEINLFELQTSKTNIKEIQHALNGEIQYNDTDFIFNTDKLIYKKG